MVGGSKMVGGDRLGAEEGCERGAASRTHGRAEIATRHRRA